MSGSYQDQIIGFNELLQGRCKKLPCQLPPQVLCSISYTSPRNPLRPCLRQLLPCCHLHIRVREAQQDGFFCEKRLDGETTCTFGSKAQQDGFSLKRGSVEKHSVPPPAQPMASHAETLGEADQPCVCAFHHAAPRRSRTKTSCWTCKGSARWQHATLSERWALQ